MKDLGIVLTALIIFFTGNYLSHEKIKRVKTLEQTVLLIRFIRTQIEFSKMPLSRIINMAADSKEFRLCKFIEKSNLLLANGNSFDNAWAQSLNEFYIRSSISEDEKNLLISYADALGSSDVNGQLQNCDTYINLIQQRICDIREAMFKSAKMINTISAFAAAFLVIAFI